MVFSSVAIHYASLFYLLLMKFIVFRNIFAMIITLLLLAIETNLFCQNIEGWHLKIAFCFGEWLYGTVFC